MGTRSNTVVVDEGKEIVRIYRQMDGYPSCHGQALKDILGESQIINGISGQKCPSSFNGMGCMAAYLIGALKGEEIGSIYIQHRGKDPNKPLNDGSEYLYTLYKNELDVRVNVRVLYVYDNKVLYDGPIEDADMKNLEKEEE